VCVILNSATRATQALCSPFGSVEGLYRQIFSSTVFIRINSGRDIREGVWREPEAGGPDLSRLFGWDEVSIRGGSEGRPGRIFGTDITRFEAVEAGDRGLGGGVARRKMFARTLFC
jgi:hypothetical protein